MDCIREAENYLRYYRELHKSVEHANRMISQLKWQTSPKGYGVAKNDITGIHANRPINTLNQLYQLQKWQEMKDRTLVEIAKVDDVLDAICKDPGCERYKDILFMWYVEKASMDQIADGIEYTERHTWRLKKDAIKKFAVALFGVTALKAV